MRPRSNETWAKAGAALFVVGAAGVTVANALNAENGSGNVVAHVSGEVSGEIVGTSEEDASVQLPGGGVKSGMILDKQIICRDLAVEASRQIEVLLKDLGVSEGFSTKATKRFGEQVSAKCNAQPSEEVIRAECARRAELVIRLGWRKSIEDPRRECLEAYGVTPYFLK